MKINQELLQTIATKISGLPLDESLITKIRTAYPGIHFTYCIDDDIPNQEAVMEYPGFNLYLVDGRDHCMCFTNTYEHATGVVVAEVIPE